MARRKTGLAWFAGFVALVCGACGDVPGMLNPASESGSLVARLGWGLIIASVVVIGGVTLVLLLGMRRAVRRGHVTNDHGAGQKPLGWIHAGVAFTVVVLASTYVATIAVLHRVVAPPDTPALTITVTGHRWWWEVQYTNPDFATANEIHIPVGASVRVLLRSPDVIHSLWVPALAGKTDLVPGEHNEMWLRASRAARFDGQCAEYCGAQHAHMALEVVAEPPEDFARWAAHQRDPAAAAQDSVDVAERGTVVQKCGACHTVRGTAAAGTIGPDLTHVASRATIAAGTLPYSPGNLGGWIADPEGVKPGTLMPRVPLASDELVAIVAYLQRLR
jgi:cytochrome c oxidase subunit 2